MTVQPRLLPSLVAVYAPCETGEAVEAEVAMDAYFLEVVWRVPNAPLFVVGFLIVGWGLASGVLAFTGSQKSGQPDIHFPRRPEPQIRADASDEDEA